MPQRVQYIEIPSRSALNRVQPESAMPFRWSLNPYRGCQHACTYCFARVTHTYMGLNAGDDFNQIIHVKADLPRLLAKELASRRWRRELVGLGTATDPYQPAEARFRLTRQALILLRDSGTPVTLSTKNTLVLRDLDLFRSFPAGQVSVGLSIMTLRQDVSRLIEPGTPPPLQRLAALRRLREAGIRTGVLMAPLLPGLTDDEANLEEVIRSAAEAGANFIWPNVCRLAPEVKAWFLSRLKEQFPHLVPLYKNLYGAGTHAPRNYTSRVRADAAALQQRYQVENSKLCGTENTTGRDLRPHTTGCEPVPTGQLRLAL